MGWLMAYVNNIYRLHLYDPGPLCWYKKIGLNVFRLLQNGLGKAESWLISKSVLCVH